MIRLLRPYLFSCVSLSLCLWPAPGLQVLMRSGVTAHTGPDTRTKTHDVMGDQEDGHNQRWRLGALHDVQHPAQNTRPAPGTGQTLAAISMGREGDWRDSKCHGEPGVRETAQRHCYTLETHSDWDVTTGLIRP